MSRAATPVIALGPVERPLLRRAEELVDADRVRIEEPAIEPVGARELARDGEREDHVGAGPRREMQIGARLAMPVRRGSTTTSCAPSRCACVTSGGKCVLLTAGFAPHTTTSRACSTSRGSAESIPSNISSHALPCVAAQIVSSTTVAPSIPNSRVGSTVCSAGAEEL